MAGVKQQRPGPGLFSDDLRHSVAAQFQIVDCRQMLLPGLIDQVCDGPSTGFCIRAAAGKRRPVLESVLVCQIPEGKPVSHNDQISLSAGSHLEKSLVDVLQFSHIPVPSRLVFLAMVRVCLNQSLCDHFYAAYGIHRRCPDVLVVLDMLFPAVIVDPLSFVVPVLMYVFPDRLRTVVIVIMASFLHTLHGLFLHGLHMIHHNHNRHIRPPRRFQYLADPVLHNASVADHHIRLLKFLHICRRRFKRVAVHACRNDQFQVYQISCDLSRKIVIREQRGRHLQPILPLVRLCLPARSSSAASGQNQSHGQHSRRHLSLSSHSAFPRIPSCYFRLFPSMVCVIMSFIMS